MMEGEVLGNRAAGGMTNDRGPADFQRIHQAQNIGRHLGNRIGDNRFCAGPGATVVMGDDIEVLRQGGHQFRPESGAPAQSGHQKYRIAARVRLAIPPDRELGVADIYFMHHHIMSRSRQNPANP